MSAVRNDLAPEGREGYGRLMIMPRDILALFRLGLRRPRTSTPAA
jgi:hypothetical protein